jgi:phage baseplate assembly protein W
VRAYWVGLGFWIVGVVTGVVSMSNTPQTINLGTCWGTPNGQDLSMPSYMASGNLVVAEAVLRRWTTTRGQLIDDPDYGENLLDLISDDLGPRDIAIKQQALEDEAMKDQRVQSASVTLVLSPSGSLAVTANVTTAAGPFQFVVTVTQVSVTLLLVSP